MSLGSGPVHVRANSGETVWPPKRTPLMAVALSKSREPRLRVGTMVLMLYDSVGAHAVRRRDRSRESHR